MFNVYIDNGDIDINQLDDICYIINKNGTFLRKKIGITDALVKVNNISHLESSVSQFGRIDIPKIPQEHFSKVVKFFQWAYEKYNGESVVLIYYNRDLNDFEIYPTDQEVSSASASYIREGRSHSGYLLVGTIHSHANFGAGHSGVDNDDELSFDGVHITVGNVNDTYNSISCSVVVNGQRFMYPPENYLDGIVEVNMTDNESNLNTIKNERYLIKGLASAEFDDSWSDKVQKRIKSQYKQETIYDNCGIMGYRFGFQDVDNEYFGQRFNNFNNNKNDQYSYDALMCQYGEIPCERCVYKDYKSQMLVQEVLGDVFDEDEVRYLLGEGDIEDDDEENEVQERK